MHRRGYLECRIMVLPAGLEILRWMGEWQLGQRRAITDARARQTGCQRTGGLDQTNWDPDYWI